MCKLAKHGVRHPVKGCNGDGNHSPLAWSIAGDSRAPIHLFTEFLNEVSDCSEPVIFVSGEEFEYLRPDAIARLAKALDPFDVEIILSLRPQFEIIRSQYGEWLKQFLTCDDFSVFWRFHAGLDDYNYCALLKNWQQAFGADHVTVLSHDEVLKLPNGLISGIIQVLGLREDDFDFSQPKNASDCAEVIALWQYMLLKLKLFSGQRFSVHDGLWWQGKMSQKTAFRERFSSIIGATRRMYLQANYPVTPFRGYSKQELIEIQTLFAEDNKQLFSLVGRQLWATKLPPDDEPVLSQLPLIAVRKADQLFVEIVGSVWAKDRNGD